MSPYSSPSSSPPPSPSRRRLKTCARRCERVCCACATYFPLAFVYSLTTWAVWVEANIGLGRTGANNITFPVKASSAFGVLLYILLNTSYTVAVYTDPGSPQDTPNSKSSSSQRNGTYSILPTAEPDSDSRANRSVYRHIHSSSHQNITVSSSGGARFCKKCQNNKPDRTHHCSTCRRCVLKMDHHCPWLATCLGLHNYKPFVLFLIYTSVFCWVCFLSSGYWLWENLLSSNQYLEDYAPINIIMLCVVSGIIGLVLTGFTGWHLWLCVRGQTTIECLEKTRYLSGVRSRVERNRLDNIHHSHDRGNSNDLVDRVKRAGDQILEFHANAVPGASRYEEGEEHTSPTPSLRQHIQQPPRMESDSQSQYQDYPPSTSPSHDTPAVRALRRSYHNTSQPHQQQQQSQSSYEHDRETTRYEEYLDDRDSSNLPNAFDLGVPRNLKHLFGENPWLWGLPVCNTTGDGWRWEVSEKWARRREEMERAKAERQRAQWEIGDGDGEEQERGFGGSRVGMGYDGIYEEEGDGEGDAHSMQTLDSRGHHANTQHHTHSHTHTQNTFSQSRNPHHQTLNSNTHTTTTHPRGRGMGRGRTLPQHHNRERVWGGRYNKDTDTSGENGEEERFEVSPDEAEPEAEGGRAYDEGDSDDDYRPGPENGGEFLERGWRRDWD